MVPCDHSRDPSSRARTTRTHLTAIDVRRTDPCATAPRSTRRRRSCISNRCRHPASWRSSPSPSNGSSDTPEVWCRWPMVAMDSKRNRSCDLQEQASMRARGRDGRRVQESGIRVSSIRRRTLIRSDTDNDDPSSSGRRGSSTADDGPSLLNAAVSCLPRVDSLGAAESGATRPIAASTRHVDRWRGVRRVESLDGGPFEWRRQQPLNVAQEPRISGRHE